MDLRAEAPPSLPPTPLRCGGGGGSWVAPTGSSWRLKWRWRFARVPCPNPLRSRSLHANQFDGRRTRGGTILIRLLGQPQLFLPSILRCLSSARRWRRRSFCTSTIDGARAVDRPPWISQIDRLPAFKLGTVRREFVWSRVAVQAWKAEIQPVFGPTACLVWIVGSRYDAMCTQEVSAL